MPPHRPREDSLVATSQRLRAGWTTCVEVLEQCLAQIDAREPEIRAWVSVDRTGALARARELDADLAAGRCLGPLHGIPIGIKDIIDVAGTPTGAGSERMSQQMAQEDATLVTRLREAGAVILGKTVTTHFACFDPPVTRNPHHADRTPGGSSSGSAAAIATGMCLGAIGTQTGGSIIRPAGYCGIAGCKPTFRRVSMAGIVPASRSLDHPGPMARTVRDLAVLLDVISGDDPRDPEAALLPPLAAADELDAFALTPPRLGRLRGLFDERADANMRRAVDAALERMQSAGATVVEVPLPAMFDDILRWHRTVMLAEIAAVHEQRLHDYPEDYLPLMRGLIEEGLSLSATQYIRARQKQAHAVREMAAVFAGFDALVCPATTGPAPDRTTTGDPACNAPWSFTGLPAVTFPCDKTADGLPLGIQLIGPAWGEVELFRAAAWCEEEGGRKDEG